MNIYLVECTKKVSPLCYGRVERNLDDGRAVCPECRKVLKRAINLRAEARVAAVERRLLSIFQGKIVYTPTGTELSARMVQSLNKVLAEYGLKVEPLKKR
jgi:hypothetical protein